jgi:hypothetical protein
MEKLPEMVERMKTHGELSDEYLDSIGMPKVYPSKDNLPFNCRRAIVMTHATQKRQYEKQKVAKEASRLEVSEKRAEKEKRKAEKQLEKEAQRALTAEKKRAREEKKAQKEAEKAERAVARAAKKRIREEEAAENSAKKTKRTVMAPDAAAQQDVEEQTSEIQPAPTISTPTRRLPRIRSPLRSSLRKVTSTRTGRMSQKPLNFEEQGSVMNRWNNSCK